MIKNLAIMLVAYLLTTSLLAAQEAEVEHIETDRDSFTPSTDNVGQSLTIVEASYSFIDNKESPETHSFPELLARYGLTEWLELRFGANYEVGGESSGVSSGSGGELDGLGGIETEAKVIYGIKTAMTQQNGWIPKSTAILQGITPTSGEETDTHLVATYVWGWVYDDIWTWDSAIRYGDASEEEDNFNRWAPSSVLKMTIAEKWSTHVEYFGIFSAGRSNELSQSYFSPGIHYLVTPDIEVGLRVGWGLSTDAANFFSNVGLGIMF